MPLYLVSLMLTQPEAPGTCFCCLHLDAVHVRGPRGDLHAHADHDKYFQLDPEKHYYHASLQVVVGDQLLIDL